MSLDAIQFELRSNKEELQMYRDSMIRSRTKPNTGKVKLYVDKITRLQDELARLKGPTRSTLSLVFNRSDGILLSPVQRRGCRSGCGRISLATVGANCCTSAFKS